MSFKRTKVVMLPTNEKAKGGDLRLQNGILFKVSYASDSESAQHLYFLSDEEIKEGDWWIDLLENRIFQVTEEDVIVAKADGLPHNGFKKIIATTDKSLVVSKDTGIVGIEYNLPQPSEGFILKFADSYNSGKPITEVDVEYISNLEQIGSEDDEYFEKLKVDPKDNTITIKKTKDTWNKTDEDLIKAFEDFACAVYGANYGKDTSIKERAKAMAKRWIEENL